MAGPGQVGSAAHGGRGTVCRRDGRPKQPGRRGFALLGGGAGPPCCPAVVRWPCLRSATADVTSWEHRWQLAVQAGLKSALNTISRRCRPRTGLSAESRPGRSAQPRAVPRQVGESGQNGSRHVRRLRAVRVSGPGSDHVHVSPTPAGGQGRVLVVAPGAVCALDNPLVVPPPWSSS
jgi:hypothetical protein